MIKSVLNFRKRIGFADNIIKRNQLIRNYISELGDDEIDELGFLEKYLSNIPVRQSN